MVSSGFSNSGSFLEKSAAERIQPRLGIDRARFGEKSSRGLGIARSEDRPSRRDPRSKAASESGTATIAMTMVNLSRSSASGVLASTSLPNCGATAIASTTPVIEEAMERAREDGGNDVRYDVRDDLPINE